MQTAQDVGHHYILEMYFTAFLYFLHIPTISSELKEWF